MKSSLTDLLINYLLKGGLLLDTKGEFETDIDIPMETSDGKNKSISIRIKCKDLNIRTIKEEK